MILTLVGMAALSAATVDEPAAAPEAGSDRQICRRVTATSSRMAPRRICKTYAEWMATARSPQADSDVEQGLDHRAHNPTTRCTGGMGGSPGPR